MLKLDIKTKTKIIHIPDILKNSFPDKLIFYAINEKNRILNEFIIINFKNSEIIYIDLFTEDNRKKIIETLGINYLNILPHSITPCNPEEDFYCFPWVFPKGNQYAFQYINYKKNIFNLYINKDFGDKFGAGSDGSFRSGSNFFLTFQRTDKKIEEGFKVSLDLSNIQKIYEDEAENRPPHEIATFKDHLIMSSFNNGRKFKIIGEDLVIDGDNNLNTYLNENPNKKFKSLSSYFKSFNIKSKEIQKWAIDDVPSHVEIDNDSLYFNNCNMGVFRNKLCFIGNSSISKVLFKDNIFINKGRFTHPTFFRGTSHSLFIKNSKHYIATIGYPNRIFVFDGNTMKLVFYYDIGNKILKDTYKENYNLLNENYNHNITNEDNHLALKASPDGKYILFLNHKTIGFLNTDTRVVDYELPYETKSGWYGRPHHCYYLR